MGPFPRSYVHHQSPVYSLPLVDLPQSQHTTFANLAEV